MLWAVLWILFCVHVSNKSRPPILKFSVVHTHDVVQGIAFSENTHVHIRYCITNDIDADATAVHIQYFAARTLLSLLNWIRDLL